MDQGRELLVRSPNTPVLLLAHSDWLSGVVGPAASRTVEELGRSAILVGPDKEPGRWKGSGRAYHADHLGIWLEGVKQLGVIERGGGHAGAVGMALRTEEISQIRAIAERQPMRRQPTSNPNTKSLPI